MKIDTLSFCDSNLNAMQFRNNDTFFISLKLEKIVVFIFEIHFEIDDNWAISRLGQMWTVQSEDDSSGLRQ
jgi:hypothetical protein